MAFKMRAIHIMLAITILNSIQASKVKIIPQDLLNRNAEDAKNNTSTPFPNSSPHKYFLNGLFGTKNKNKAEPRNIHQPSSFFALESLIKFAIDNSNPRSMPETSKNGN